MLPSEVMGQKSYQLPLLGVNCLQPHQGLGQSTKTAHYSPFQLQGQSAPLLCHHNCFGFLACLCYLSSQAKFSRDDFPLPQHCGVNIQKMLTPQQHDVLYRCSSIRMLPSLSIQANWTQAIKVGSSGRHHTDTCADMANHDGTLMPYKTCML